MPGGGEGRSLRIVRDAVVVGKGRRADFSFPRDEFMSRRQAEIVRTARGVVVRDLGSTNRTFLIVRNEQLLVDGDRIVMGAMLFEYRQG